MRTFSSLLPNFTMEYPAHFRHQTRILGVRSLCKPCPPWNLFRHVKLCFLTLRCVGLLAFEMPRQSVLLFFSFRQLLHPLVPFAKNRCVFGDASFAVTDAFMKQLLFDMPHHHSVLFKTFFSSRQTAAYLCILTTPHGSSAK